MREYFREEGLKFRYFPPFILLRLALIAIVFIVGQIQWLFVAVSVPFSFGFLYDTEAEHMLPLSYEELSERRRLRVKMVWLRYLIICLGSVIIHYVMMSNGIFNLDPHDSALLRRPLLVAFYFVLQMVIIYHALLTASLSQRTGKKEKKPVAVAVKRFVLYHLPTYVYFVYGAGFAINSYVHYGSQWIHISVIVVATILMLIHTYQTSKQYSIPDYSPALKTAEV